jgi:hypothetical protein
VRAGLQVKYVDNRRSQVSQARRLFDDLFDGASPGGYDQKGNMQLGLVEV